MNTTKLISHWTMSGAEVGGRFRAIDDIGAAIADNRVAPEPTPATTSFSIRGSDEEGWQPLGGGSGD